MIISIPVEGESYEPEIIFSVKNTGSDDIKVSRVFSKGSELSWKGPRDISWIDVTGVSHGPSQVSVPAKSELIIDRLPIADVYLRMPAGAALRKVKLEDGDTFNLTWILEEKRSNELIFRYHLEK